MSMKLLQTFTEGNQTAKLYKDSEWQEYRVKFYIDGKHLLDADYHTDDRRDAQSSALEQLRRGLTLTRTNPVAKSPRRVSQITGKPPSKRLKARRAKKHVPGYFPNPAPKSPRRVSQITGKPPSKRLKARRAKKHVPGYFTNPRKSQSVGLGYMGAETRTGPVTDFWGAETGRYEITSSWKTPRSFVSDRMFSLRVTLNDGTQWTGRSAGKSMAISGKPAAPRRNPLPSADFIPGAGVPKSSAQYPNYRIEARAHKGKRGGWKPIGGFETAKDAEQYARAYANLHGVQVRVMQF